ncbi:MAG: glycosyltransferase [Steroidobacteraceae bacterium]
MKEPYREVEISAIVPVGKRQADPVSLFHEYRDALASTGQSFEIVFVLDGPHPGFYSGLRSLLDAGEQFTVVGLSRTFGESTALMAGLEHSSGRVILTLPAYHQVDITDIQRLLCNLGNSDMVIARRWPRRGNVLDRARRATFHALVSSVTGVRFRDLGCGVRCFDRDVLADLHLYGEQHRFLPLLANRLGFRVSEVNVGQSLKDQFAGGYGVRDYLRSLLDLFSIFFITRFTKRPLRFFGTTGVATSSIGGAIICWLVFERIVYNVGLADRPALLLSSLLVVLGLQLLALGLLGELIIYTHAAENRDYQIERIIRH